MSTRLSAVRKIMKEHQADAFLVKKPQNVFYLSGLRATRANLLITARSAYLLVDFRYYLKAKKESHLPVQLIEGKFEKYLSEFLAKKKVKNLAFESNFLTFQEAQQLKKSLSVKLIPADSWVQEVRQIKSEKEIALLKKAAKLADKAMAFAKHSVSLGMSELQLAKRIECFIRQSGARSESFEVIVASGPNSALPHHSSSQRPIKASDILLIDLGVKLENYVSDITRTFLLQPVKNFARQLYLDCLEAQKQAINKVTVGINTKIVDGAARSFIDAKHPNKFKHNTGHGIGLEVHEAPVIGPRHQDKLVNNMVFTVEPGIYLVGKGGVRIEDMVQVTSYGSEILTKSPKELEAVIIEL